MELLISGASGFLGKEIINKLEASKSNSIMTIGRSVKNNIIFDFSKDETLLIDKKYDVLIHIAGKAHSIPKTKEEEEEFFKINHIGTKKILNSFNVAPPKTIVFISTVAVYGRDYGEMIDETHSLLGSTPYAKSKILAEQEIIKFSESKKTNYLILRLPLIIGNKPPGNLGAMMKAIKKGYYFRIGKGLAKKSVVSSKDIAELIPNVLNKTGIYNLTDLKDPKFFEIENHVADLYRKKIIAIPLFLFVILAKIGDLLPFFIINTNKLNKITKHLTFSSEKAVNELNWNPKPALSRLLK